MSPQDGCVCVGVCVLKNDGISGSMRQLVQAGKEQREGGGADIYSRFPFPVNSAQTFRMRTEGPICDLCTPVHLAEWAAPALV